MEPDTLLPGERLIGLETTTGGITRASVAEAMIALTQFNNAPLPPDTDAKAAALAPALQCCLCNRHVTGFTGIWPEFPLPLGIRFGPGERLGYKLQNRNLYIMECGCRVTQEWAGKFGEEIRRRREGVAPRVLDSYIPLPMSIAELHSTIYEAYRCEQLCVLASAGNVEMECKERWQYNIVALWQHYGRYYGLAEGATPWLLPKMEAWRRTNRFEMPPVTATAMAEDLRSRHIFSRYVGNVRPATRQADEDGFTYPPGYPMPRRRPLGIITSPGNLQGQVITPVGDGSGVWRTLYQNEPITPVARPVPTAPDVVDSPQEVTPADTQIYYRKKRRTLRRPKDDQT